MTFLSALPLVADIVVPPPPPPTSHPWLSGSPVPYVILAVVAIGALWWLRQRRPAGR